MEQRPGDGNGNAQSVEPHSNYEMMTMDSVSPRQRSSSLTSASYFSESSHSSPSSRTMYLLQPVTVEMDGKIRRMNGQFHVPQPYQNMLFASPEQVHLFQEQQYALRQQQQQQQQLWVNPAFQIPDRVAQASSSSSSSAAMPLIMINNNNNQQQPEQQPPQQQLLPQQQLQVYPAPSDNSNSFDDVVAMYLRQPLSTSDTPVATAVSSGPVRHARRKADFKSPVFSTDRLANVSASRSASSSESSVTPPSPYAGPGSVFSASSSQAVPVATFDPRRYCTPCTLVTGIGPEPLTVLKQQVPLRFMVSKKDRVGLSEEELNGPVGVNVRVMGKRKPHMSIWELYVVAKDICLVLHVRKGNVAKRVANFDSTEKSRMRVQCPRADGEGWSEHEVLVLSFKGVRRLLLNSRSSNRHTVLEWITTELNNVCASCTALDDLLTVASEENQQQQENEEEKKV